MAQEVIINVQASTAEANKNLEKLNATILEQKEILVELERELYKVESAQNQTSQTSLSAQKALRDEAEHLTSSIKDQRLSLKELNVQQQNTEAALDSVNTSSQQVAGSFEDVAGNGGAMAILDTLTGGLATRMRDAFEATKLFNVSLKATKTALIATGIGAFVVALGLVVAYWDDIVGFITNANNKLEDQIALNKRNITQIDHEIGLLELQKGILEANGESTAATNKKIEEAILLRQEENRILTDNLRKQLEAERAEINKVTFLEEAEISLYRSLGLYEKMAAAQAESLIGTKEQLEALNALDAQVKESEKKQLEFELKLATLRKTERDKEKEKEAEKKKGDEEELKYQEGVYERELAALQKRIDDEFNIRLEGEKKIGALRRSYFLQNLGDTKEAALIKLEFDRDNVLDEIKASGANDAQKRMAAAEVTKYYDEQVLLTTKEFEDKKTKELKEAEDFRNKIRQANLQLAFDSAAGILGALSDLNSIYDKKNEEEAKRSFEKNKKLQVALTIVSTLAAAQSAYQSQIIPLDPTSPIRGAIAAGVALFSGYARVRGIESTRFESTAKPEPETDGGGRIPTAPSAPPSFNVVGASDSSQLAGVIANQSQQPIQAYVVSNDVTTAQSLDRNIIESVGI